MSDRQPGGVVELRRPRAPLGRILVDRSALNPDDLSAALTHQRRTGARLGEVLAANGWSDCEQIAAALAGQRGLTYYSAIPPVREDIKSRVSYAEVKRHHAFPIREESAQLVLATADPDQAKPLGDRLNAKLAIVSPATFQQAVCTVYGAQIADAAANRTPAARSVRSLKLARFGFVLLLLALAATATVMLDGVLLGLLGVIALVTVLTTATRFAALAFSRKPQARQVSPDAILLSEHRPPPTISLLIPMYREGEVVQRLIEGLERLDYPRDRLDVKLLIEADDPCLLAALFCQTKKTFLRKFAQQQFVENSINSV